MLERYLPSKRDTWTWHLADLKDVVEIVNSGSSVDAVPVETLERHLKTWSFEFTI